ncbi:hypothetical protein [Kordia sp.]|uniref:hypothetical protein n=1 Tax=Kordia sp. TaxID=1965332 RepID=UPI003D6AA8A5
MKYTKPTYLAFFTTAFISLLVAILFEKICLVYVYPLTFLSIVVIYLKEKKEPTSALFLLALFFGLCGGLLLILGLKNCLPEISICISIFYTFYIRLMYLKNEKKKTTAKIYFRLLFFFIPVVYMYDRVFSLVYEEIRDVFIYFAIMGTCMLVYIMVAIYYYLRNKNQSNLWMLITAVNLGIMNIIITINELYIYETMFTVIVVFCSNFFLFFSLKFMLEDEKNTLVDIT